MKDWIKLIVTGMAIVIFRRIEGDTPEKEE